MITGKKHSELPQFGKYPRAVCGLGLGSSSSLCPTCNKCCIKRCVGVEGSLNSVRNFVCPKCAGVTDGSLPVVDEPIQLEAGTLEEVKSFCYLIDVLET